MATVSNNTVICVVKLEGRIVFLLDLEKIVANLTPPLGLLLDDLGETWYTSVRHCALVSDDSSLFR